MPSDTWIFPLLLSYDEPEQVGHYVGIEWVTTTETYQLREKINAQFDHTGAWAFFFVASSTTCEPVIVACPGPVGGGA